MNKKVVVFGGSGFLGSHVADALSDAGYDVVIYYITHYLFEDIVTFVAFLMYDQ